MTNLNIKTVELNYEKKEDGISLTDITRQVEHSVVDSKMQNGIVTVCSESSNTSITTMEFEPGSIKDIKDTFERFNSFKESTPHEGHDIRSSLIGPSITVPFKDNRIMVGKWQQIVLIDFDKTKEQKKVIVQILGE